jgi:glyoxylase-like metal-dependent hydrolase (beta-lactamase superfamily II)
MQITKQIHAIKVPFSVTNDQGMTIERFVYSYVVKGEKICLIDSGISGSENIIYEYLENIGINPDEISMMILTHSHPDHIGSAPSIKARTGCKVAAHRAEKPWIENIELQFHERPLPNFYKLVEGSVQIDIILDDGNMIDLGDNTHIKVIHTPGHSKGSITLYLSCDGVLITGDSIPLKGDLPIYEDVNDSIESIEKLMMIDGVQTLLASWDDPRRNEAAYETMTQGISYLKQIHETVHEVFNKKSEVVKDPLEFTKLVLKELGLPEMVANPIIVRSFKSNMDTKALVMKNTLNQL